MVKRFFSLTLCAVMLMTVCLTLGACSSVQNPMDYGKKYKISDDRFYVFYANHTGYYECRYAYDSGVDAKYDYTLAGQVEFIWEEAADGAVYLFATERHYFDEHTAGKTLILTDDPIYFSEDFLVIKYGESTTRAIKEGSDLEKKLQKTKEKDTQASDKSADTSAATEADTRRTYLIN